MKALGHIATIAVILGIFLGVPAFLYADIPAILSGGADTVSSATVIQDAPSGHYVILINRELHTDEEALANWRTFFSGGDAPLIMEDVSCVALEGDAGGIDMATSLQSRLAENQMTLRIEDGTLALSKAEAGKFDVIVMSAEAAEAFGVDTLMDVETIEVIER